jgi:hypothetical protein
MPTKEDVLLETIKIYYDATKKSDKKRSAKLIQKHKIRLQELGFWKYINEKELNKQLN